MDGEVSRTSEDELFSLDFDPDDMTEDDIDRIWERMKRQSAKERKTRKKFELNLCSTDTTPTTGKIILKTLYPRLASHLICSLW